MESKIKLIFVILILITINSCNGQVDKVKNNKEEIVKVKKYILCNCLYETFLEKEKIREQEGSSSHYFQISKLSLEVFTYSLDFLKNYLKKTEKKYINFYEKSNIGMVRCIDLYESKELDEFIKKTINEN